MHAGEGAAGDAHSFDLSAYDNGPVHLGAGFPRSRTATRRYAIRGFHAELGAFTFGAYWQHEEDTGTALRASRNIARVSAMYTMGASEFVNIGGTQAGGTSFNGGHLGGKQWTLGYNYNLSKRTKVYGYYTAIDSTQPGNHQGGRLHLAGSWHPPQLLISDQAKATLGSLFHGRYRTGLAGALVEQLARGFGGATPRWR